MADVLATLDPDAFRRRRWFRDRLRHLAAFPHQPVSSFESGDFAIAWSTAIGAPVSWRDTDSFSALLVGEARREGDARSLTAIEAARSWLEDDRAPEDWDGFHLLVVFDKIRHRLLAGADCLGTFPVYHLESAATSTVATNLSLLAGHPHGDETLDEEGLAGILHTTGLVGGRTLFRGIRRLAPAKVLEGSPGRRRFLSQVGIPWLERSAGWDTTDPMAQAGILATAAADAARELFPSRSSTGLLLSGGLDSRTLAGFLRELGIHPTTASFGAPREIESLVARQVARHLRLSHRNIAEPFDRYGEAAAWNVRREGLSAGLSLLFGSLLVDPHALGALADRVATGIQLEPVFGGLFQAGARDLHNLGFLPATFAALGPSSRLRDAHQAMLATLEAEEAAHPGDAGQRRWLQDLHQHARFPLGTVLWRLSFSSWPVPLSLHRNLLATRRALPFAGEPFSQRKVQRRLVVDRFPDLASLPFDANAFDWYFLRPSPWNRLREVPLRVHRKLAALRRRESRYYHRTEDLRQPHWDRLRREAEPGREFLGALFDRAKLDAFLPRPDHPIPGLEDPFAGSAPHRLLLGLMLHATTPRSEHDHVSKPTEDPT